MQSGEDLFEGTFQPFGHGSLLFFSVPHNDASAVWSQFSRSPFVPVMKVMA